MSGHKVKSKKSEPKQDIIPPAARDSRCDSRMTVWKRFRRALIGRAYNERATHAGMPPRVTHAERWAVTHAERLLMRCKR
jgi:hypothetical protein